MKVSVLTLTIFVLCLGVKAQSLSGNSAYSGGSGDFTNVSGAPLTLQAPSGYIRVPHKSAHASVSTVYNYETGKSIYWGEDGDGGAYIFRGRNIGVGTTSPVSLLTLNKSGSGAQTSELLIQSNNVSVARFGWNATGPGFVDISSLYNNNHIVLSPTGTGNVGIGTSSPDSRLTVTASGPASIFSMSAPGANAYFKMGLAADYAWLQSYGPRPLRINDLGNDVIFNTGGGNVGIGTASPDARLTVTTSAPGDILSMSASGANAYFKMGLAADYAWLQSYGSRPLRVNDLGNDVIFNTEGGKVGIGTSSPDKPLTVKGTIHTTEVLVDMSVPGPDYVFEKDYDLLPLTELETYINKNKHLPEVPSAKEMETDGLNLKEMNLLLLKKVEELTLHVINQEKRINNLEQENKELRSSLQKK
jgi:hypothetical protein